jgi:Ca2+-binding RTX toxin-like protein
MAATYQYLALPTPIAAEPGAVVDIETILSGAFGSNYGGYSDYLVAYYGPLQLQAWTFSYWDPTTPSVARWFVNGSDIGGEFTHQTDVPLSQLSSADLHVGNDIGPLAFITVPTAGTPGNWSAYTQYALITIAPSLISPTAGDGEPTPADIVASANRFAAAYVDVPNTEDCHHIAEAVAGAAGATLPYLSYNTDPTQNQEGGFWRIAYKGSDPNPVAHWQTLVQPGDIVRMAWKSGGEHTTLVLSVNSDGTIQVYDNIGYEGKTEIIAIHKANYDPDTIPTSITIYRLTPDHVYLVNGTDQDESVAGTVFNDLVAGGAGNDTLRSGVGADTFDGGDGQDTVDYGAAGSAVVVDLNSGSYYWLDQHSARASGLSHEQGLGGRGSGGLVGGDDGGGADSYATSGSLISIENVVGSAFNDTLTGSSSANRLDGAAGDDVLNGRAGDDILIGGAGDDRFVFAVGDGRDVVWDFVAGDSSGDVIDLAGYGIMSFTELQGHMRQVGNDVVITLDAADEITLHDVVLSSLNARDFAFASAAAWSQLEYGRGSGACSSAGAFALPGDAASQRPGEDRPDFSDDHLSVPPALPHRDQVMPIDAAGDPHDFGDADWSVPQRGDLPTSNLSEFLLV